MRDARGGEVRVGARLGHLYLEQGHLDEAEAIFRAVLDRRRRDGEARRGLAEVERRRRSAAGSAGGAGVRRRIERLRAYLERLERGAGTPSSRADRGDGA